MSRRNKRIGEDKHRSGRWRGAQEFLHAEPRQTVGNTHLVLKTRQSGVTK
jgi:hypothetical protein